MTDTSSAADYRDYLHRYGLKKYPSQTAYSAAAAGERGRADG